MDTDAPFKERTSSTIAALQYFSKLTSIVVFLIGCVVILGWVFDLTALKSVLPGAVAMKANTAIGLISGGVSLWLWHFEKDAGKRGRACAILVLSIGLLTLIEYGFNLDLGIDRLLFDTPLDPLGDAYPGRMAVQTASIFVLLGSALLLLSLKHPNYFAAQVLAALAFPIAFLGLLGYVYGDAHFYRFGSVTSIAVHTAVAFLLLCLGILLARPEQGIVAIFTSNDAGGIVARRLFPAVMIVSPLVCWLTLLGYRSHLYTADLGTGISSVLNTIIFAALVWWNARSLSALDRRRDRAETALKQAKVGLEERVKERTTQLEQANEQLQSEVGERQQTETALRESELLYSTLAEAVPEILFTNLPDGRSDYCNQRWHEYTGLTYEQTKVFGWGVALHPDDLEPSVACWMDSVRTGNPFNVEYRLKRADGVYRWFRARSLPMRDDRGQIVKWFGVCMDIDEQKQAEVERAQILVREQAARESAEAANRIKDEFLAVLSHELRTPLNPILGWAKLLRANRLDEAKTAYALETIERNAKLQTQLIEDLLDVSRILQGKLSLNVYPVDLVATIEAAIETVRLVAESKSIQISTVFDPSVGRVSGDPNRLQQVVWNLLSNAVKFTPQGGRVEVQLSVVSGQWSVVGDRQTTDNGQRTTDTYAQIQVSDTGKGINPDFLPYIFDYFRQENSATTRKFGGLGLGLAIVRHLVELHGGTVRASSSGEGQGATFTVALPLLKGSQEEVMNEGNDSSLLTPHSSPLEGLQILVVDDEVDTLEFLAFFLKQNGAEVRAVASAREALEVFAQWQPDLLLSDVGMPETDGYMLMRQIRAMPSQRGLTPAIALTAYAGESDYQQVLQAGFQRHITKPVDLAELVAAIANLAGRTGS